VFGWLRALVSPSDSAPEQSESAPAQEVLDALQKLSRATAKQSARLEAAIGESDARLTTLLEALRKQSAASSAREAPDAARYDELFDALDALDEARALAREPHLYDGLLRVRDKLLRFLERAGYSRVAEDSGVPDGRLMRVVGTEPRSELAPGTITRVVRAAIVAGGRVVREGEVIVSTEVQGDERHVGN
jgi:molecular chaperone GrpE (heat shock protein)